MKSTESINYEFPPPEQLHRYDPCMDPVGLGEIVTFDRKVGLPSDMARFFESYSYFKQISIFVYGVEDMAHWPVLLNWICSAETAFISEIIVITGNTQIAREVKRLNKGVIYAPMLYDDINKETHQQRTHHNFSKWQQDRHAMTELFETSSGEMDPRYLTIKVPGQRDYVDGFMTLEYYIRVGHELAARNFAYPVTTDERKQYLNRLSRVRDAAIEKALSFGYQVSTFHYTSIIGSNPFKALVEHEDVNTATQPSQPLIYCSHAEDEAMELLSVEHYYRFSFIRPSKHTLWFWRLIAARNQHLDWDDSTVPALGYLGIIDKKQEIPFSHEERLYFKELENNGFRMLPYGFYSLFGSSSMQSVFLDDSMMRVPTFSIYLSLDLWNYEVVKDGRSAFRLPERWLVLKDNHAMMIDEWDMMCQRFGCISQQRRHEIKEKIRKLRIAKNG